MQNGREVYEAAYRAGWRPEPRLTVSAWADEHMVLGNRAGHAAIRFRTATTPYLREIMNALGVPSENPVHVDIFVLVRIPLYHGSHALHSLPRLVLNAEVQPISRRRDADKNKG